MSFHDFLRLGGLETADRSALIPRGSPRGFPLAPVPGFSTGDLEFPHGLSCKAQGRDRPRIYLSVSGRVLYT